MNKKRNKRPRPRLPIGAALKLRSHPVESVKGGKVYKRARVKEEDRRSGEENSSE